MTDEVNQGSYLAKFVGEGAKYSSADELAKGYANAEAFMEQLKNENAALREVANAQENTKDILEVIREEFQKNPVSEEQSTDDNQSEGNQFNKEDLATLVRDVLQEDNRKAQATNNLNSVAQFLAETYGEENTAKVKEQMAENLGVSVSFLDGVASRSPEAFKRLAGTQQKPSAVSGESTKGTINTLGLGNEAKPKSSFQEYKELRKADPSRAFSPEVQNKLFKELKEAIARGEGDTFFN